MKSTNEGELYDIWGNYIYCEQEEEVFYGFHGIMCTNIWTACEMAFRNHSTQSKCYNS